MERIKLVDAFKIYDDMNNGLPEPDSTMIFLIQATGHKVTVFQ